MIWECLAETGRTIKERHQRSDTMKRLVAIGLFLFLGSNGAMALDPAIIKAYDPNRIQTVGGDSGLPAENEDACTSCQNHRFGLKRLFPKPWGGMVNNGTTRGCYANHNGNGCGSFTSDAVFILGSSRAFFNEPCHKRSGPTPWELLYGPHMATAPHVLPPGQYAPSRPTPTPSVIVD